MARARNIKPGFFQNDELGELDPIARLLFIGLWTIADFKGCIEFRPKRIKAQLLPYDKCDIDELAINLDKSGFISIYSVQGQKYIKVVNFDRHQNPHKNERDAGSDLPDISEKDNEINELKQDGTTPDKNGTNRADSLFLIPSSLIPDSPILIAERKQVARGSRLPQDFEPDFEFAVSEGIQNTLEEANKFRDYWNSTPGQKGVKLDWQATWRNWCRNAKPKPSTSAFQNRNPNKQEALEARNREIGRAWAAGETSGEFA